MFSHKHVLVLYLHFLEQNTNIGLFEYIAAVAAAAKSHQSCATLSNLKDGSPPGSSVPGVLQARILEWVAISSSNACMYAKLLQLCPTLCNPMDSSPPGSPVHRIVLGPENLRFHGFLFDKGDGKAE